jgi:hypothetical protein
VTGCAVELVAGGLGGVCMTAVAVWYLLRRRAAKVADLSTE